MGIALKREDPAVEASGVEARLTGLERDVTHIREDLGGVKVELRDFRARFDRVAEAANAQFAALRTELSEVKVGQEQLRADVNIAHEKLRTEQEKLRADLNVAQEKFRTEQEELRTDIHRTLSNLTRWLIGLFAAGLLAAIAKAFYWI
jgi:DNA repair exonuclease SbcCD ATPase subunit